MNIRKIVTNCFSPLVNENDRIQNLKPMLILSLFLLTSIILLDYFIFETTNYIYLSLLTFPIFILILKRFYYIFTIFSMIFIIFVLPKIINDLGHFFQAEIITTMSIVIFSMKFVCFILLLMIYYIFFQYYKELRYLYVKEKMNIQQNTTTSVDDNDDKNNFIENNEDKNENSINDKNENEKENDI